MTDAPFKDAIHREAIGALAAELRAVGELDRKAFVRDALDGLDELELKARVRQVAAALRVHLAPRYPTCGGGCPKARAHGCPGACDCRLSWKTHRRRCRSWKR